MKQTIGFARTTPEMQKQCNQFAIFLKGKIKFHNTLNSGGGKWQRKLFVGFPSQISTGWHPEDDIHFGWFTISPSFCQPLSPKGFHWLFWETKKASYNYKLFSDKELRLAVQAQFTPFSAEVQMHFTARKRHHWNLQLESEPIYQPFTQSVLAGD